MKYVEFTFVIYKIIIKYTIFIKIIKSITTTTTIVVLQEFVFLFLQGVL